MSAVLRLIVYLFLLSLLQFVSASVIKSLLMSYMSTDRVHWGRLVTDWYSTPRRPINYGLNDHVNYRFVQATEARICFLNSFTN